MTYSGINTVDGLAGRCQVDEEIVNASEPLRTLGRGSECIEAHSSPEVPVL